MIDRIERFLSLALRFQGEVDHHDRVLLHDANEHDQANERVDVQVSAGDQCLLHGLEALGV